VQSSGGYRASEQRQLLFSSNLPDECSKHDLLPRLSFPRHAASGLSLPGSRQPAASLSIGTCTVSFTALFSYPPQTSVLTTAIDHSLTTPRPSWTRPRPRHDSPLCSFHTSEQLPSPPPPLTHGHSFVLCCDPCSPRPPHCSYLCCFTFALFPFPPVPPPSPPLLYQTCLPPIFPFYVGALPTWLFTPPNLVPFGPPPLLPCPIPPPSPFPFSLFPSPFGRAPQYPSAARRRASAGSLRTHPQAGPRVDGHRGPVCDVCRACRARLFFFSPLERGQHVPWGLKSSPSPIFVGRRSYSSVRRRGNAKPLQSAKSQLALGNMV